MMTTSTTGLTRRDLLRQSARFVGAAMALQAWPRAATTLFADPMDALQQAAGDAAASMRQQMGAIPITTTPLAACGRYDPARKVTAYSPQNAVLFQRFGLDASRALTQATPAASAPTSQ